MRCCAADQFNPGTVTYSISNTDSKRAIHFTWIPFNISTCPTIPYRILAANCGNCPTATNYTNVTCTDVPVNNAYCSFALIPTICGGATPSLSVLIDVELNGNNYYINIP